MMQAQLEALQEISTFLVEQNIPHFVIGGIANAIWGRPRATFDADLKILLPFTDIDVFIKNVGTRFSFRVADPLSFAQELFVVLLQSSSGIDIDLVIGFLPYEESAHERVQWLTYEGVTFPVCTAEDLIIHKAISERPQDWLDIEGVLQRQQDKLDQAYIRQWLLEFANLLEKQELLHKYEVQLNKLS